MYSLAHILDPQFDRTWQEAVAIVQQFADASRNLDVLPLPADVSLTDEGEIVLGFAGESGEHPVASLATLLAGLLIGVDAPEALRSLATDNAKPTPAYATVTSFAGALAFFERPGRVRDLRAVASRLRVARLPELDPENELERLREKVVAASPERFESATARPAAGGVRIRAAALLPAAAIGLGIAAVLMVLGWGAYALYRSATPPVVVDAQDAKIEPLPEPAKADEAETTSRTVARGATRATSSPSARPSTSPASRAPAEASGDPMPLDPLQPEVHGSLPGSAVERAIARDQRDDSPWADDGPGPVYSAAHPNIQAPVLVRRQMPSGVLTDDDTGYFDLLIDQHGFVERVRLVSHASHFHERMLVSAAKAWQFRPARLNGQPVRYRTRIPITLERERR